MVGVGENDIKNGEWLVEIKSKMVSAGKLRQCRATRDQLRPTLMLFHHAPTRCGQGTLGLDQVDQRSGYSARSFSSQSKDYCKTHSNSTSLCYHQCCYSPSHVSSSSTISCSSLES